MTRWGVFGASWILLSLLASVWALATPAGASPDEPAHMVKAASVVRGQFIGEPSALGHIVQVPQYVAYTHAQTCYAFKPDTSGECIPEVPGDPWKLVDSTTSAGLYNPLYYLMVGWPSLIFHDQLGIFAMRAVSGIVSSFFLALAFAVVSTWRRRTLPLLALAVATTPMLLFLCGSVNPNAIETTSMLAAFVGLIAILRQPSSALLSERSIIVASAGIVAANARGLSLLWLAVAVLIPFILVSKPQLLALLRERWVRTAISAVGVAVVFAVMWLRYSNSLVAAIGQPNVINAPYIGSSPLIGFFGTLEQTMGHSLNMVGIFGWLDAPAPQAVYFVWAVFVGTLLMLVIALVRGRRLLLVSALAIAVVLLPAIVQGAYIQGGGLIWQGRYTLPIFVCLVLAAAVMLAETHEFVLPRRVVVTVCGIWALAQFYAFSVALRRYVVGSNESWLDFVFEPEWLPPGGSALSVLLFGLFAALAAVLLYRLISGSRSECAAVLVEPTSEPDRDDVESKPKKRTSNQGN